MYGSVAEGGGRGVASGLWLEGKLQSMLTGMLTVRLGHHDSDLNLDPKTQTHQCVCPMLSDRETLLKLLSMTDLLLD